MSSGTSLTVVTKKDLSDLERLLRNLAKNTADKFEDTIHRNMSMALCFDVLLEVMDRRRKPMTPKISDEVKTVLKERRDAAEQRMKEASEKAKEANANPTSNAG